MASDQNYTLYYQMKKYGFTVLVSETEAIRPKNVGSLFLGLLSVCQVLTKLLQCWRCMQKCLPRSLQYRYESYRLLANQTQKATC